MIRNNLNFDNTYSASKQAVFPRTVSLQTTDLLPRLLQPESRLAAARFAPAAPWTGCPAPSRPVPRESTPFSVKNVSTFFMKWDVTACGQQNGHDRFVAASVAR
ncbi:hypothetical protein EN829_046910 [Mesorhizobium sp. M00.F.Ca.ET.186.01.1.1]|nr:hypothetical protein EN829_046910 [Mesorhizobium sp. M00.F.Ca.ET.186.01.1.1]